MSPWPVCIGWPLLWDDIRTQIEADLHRERSVLREQIASALALLGKRLLEEPAVQDKLNAWWLNAADQIIVRYRHQISGLIREVVKGWDAEEVSRKVEPAIHPPVGGAVGEGDAPPFSGGASEHGSQLTFTFVSLHETLRSICR